MGILYIYTSKLIIEYVDVIVLIRSDLHVRSWLHFIIITSYFYDSNVLYTIQNVN